MAEKGFGVKEINLIGPSGTPTIESPNNLNLNANNVAISTNVSIGGTLTVTGNVSVGGTLTYEDVTNIDSVGIITARSDVIVGRGLTVTGISTFSGDVHFSLHNAGNPKIQFDESGNLLWFKAPTVGGTSSKLWLGNGTSYNNLELVTDYTGGGLAQINVSNANLIIRTNNTGKNIELQSQNDLTLANGVYPFIKGEKNSSSDQSVTLYYGQTGSTPYANPKLETTSTGVNVTGAITVNGSALSIDPTNSDIQVVYNVTANGASAYRFAGNGVVSTADNPDLYLIRGQKYRFINNSGGSHPFEIRSSSGGSAYNTGVTNNGAASGNIDFAPTFDSPDQLFYQCTSHGGMVGNIYLRSAAGAYGPAFRAILNSFQILSNATSSVIIFQSDSGTLGFDTDSCYNTSNGRFTPNRAGYYLIKGQLQFSQSTGNYRYSTRLYKNGSVFCENQSWNDGSNSELHNPVSTIVSANGSSDYFQIVGEQHSGGNITITASNSTYFEAHFIRPL